MINEQLKLLVIDEATKLREHATEEERGFLNFDSLDSDDAYLCIYGQMTGYCYSERAKQLLNLCAKPYSSSLVGNTFPITDENFDRRTSTGNLFSPIESFIARDTQGNKKLLSYIKGEIDFLTTDML